MCLTGWIKACLTLFVQLVYDKDAGPVGRLRIFPRITIVDYPVLSPSVSFPIKYFPHWERRDSNGMIIQTVSFNVLWFCCHNVVCIPGFVTKEKTWKSFLKIQWPLPAQPPVLDHKGLLCHYPSVYSVLQSSMVERINNNFLLHKIRTAFHREPRPQPTLRENTGMSLTAAMSQGCNLILRLFQVLRKIRRIRCFRES